jgi:hypothetical protein
MNFSTLPQAVQQAQSVYSQYALIIGERRHFQAWYSLPVR